MDKETMSPTHLSPEDYAAIDDYRQGGDHDHYHNYYSWHGDFEGAILLRQEEESGQIS